MDDTGLEIIWMTLNWRSYGWHWPGDHMDDIGLEIIWMTLDWRSYG